MKRCGLEECMCGGLGQGRVFVDVWIIRVCVCDVCLERVCVKVWILEECMWWCGYCILSLGLVYVLYIFKISFFHMLEAALTFTIV